MKYRDPNRQRLLNQRPCWRDSMIALPRLEVEPLADEAESNLLYLRVCHGGRGVWLETKIHKLDFLAIVHDWELDPEETFKRLFKLPDWPKGFTDPRLVEGGPPKTKLEMAERAEDLI